MLGVGEARKGIDCLSILATIRDTSGVETLGLKYIPPNELVVGSGPLGGTEVFVATGVDAGFEGVGVEAIGAAVAGTSVGSEGEDSSLP